MEKTENSRSSVVAYFSLNRLKPHCHFPPVTVDFSDPLPKHNQTALFPVYNHDHKHFTPAFVLPSQQPSSSTYLSSEEQKFRDKMLSECKQEECPCLQPPEPLLQPSESRYCQICKERFEDYWTHMSGRVHQKRLSQNEYNQDIAFLCSKFNSSCSRGPVFETKVRTGGLLVAERKEKKGGKEVEEGGTLGLVTHNTQTV